MSAEELHLALLGKPRVTTTKAPLHEFTYSKTLALLGYLAATGQPHSRDTLAGLLWGELPDEHARANLRKVLSDLRRDLAPYLIIDRHAVALDRRGPYWLDTEIFESKLESIRAAAERGLLNEPEIRLLKEATDLYSGDFMEGFYVHEAPAFEEWVLLKRERLREMQLAALHLLAKYYASRGAYTTGIAYTSKLLALEPWHEDFHRQMMLLLALNGQRSAALRQYETCCRILKQELDVEPSQDTEALYRQVQAGEVSVPAPRAIPPHNLLAQVTPFIGRQTELRAIEDRLSDPECRLLTLVGIAGTGKTRLALQAASHLLQSFPDGVYLVTVDASESADVQARDIASAVGLCLEDERSPVEQVLEHLSGKKMLLVLDNAEQLRGGVELLGRVLHQAQDLKLLLTSLERCDLEGEWVLPVMGMAMPESESAVAIADAPAVQLFLAGARRVQADFALGPDNQAAVAGICRLVDGLPLAIELAAAWVRMLPCDEIAEEIETNLDFLATSSKGIPGRHRSLRAVFEYCWVQLSAEERDVFSRLSVFRGSFRREAAEQVAGASLHTLASLIDRSLVQKSSFGRYTIHNFLREYGAQELAEDQAQLVATRDRHCVYFSDFAARREMQLHGPRQQQALDELAAEMENIRAAWAWASDRVDATTGQRQDDALSSYGLPAQALAGAGMALYRALSEVNALFEP